MTVWKLAISAFFRTYWFVYVLIAALIATSTLFGFLPWEQFERIVLFVGLFTIMIIADVHSRIQDYG